MKKIIVLTVVLFMSGVIAGFAATAKKAVMEKTVVTAPVLPAGALTVFAKAKKAPKPTAGERLMKGTKAQIAKYEKIAEAKKASDKKAAEKKAKTK